MADWDSEFEAILRPHLVRLSAGSPIEPGLQLNNAGVDSLAMIELLVVIEDTFGIEFPDELLTGQTFRTPASLWSAVSALRGTVGAESDG
jgi:acyl carrier protein